MTLLNNTVLTLTGTVSGTTFTVSDNIGDMCTGTVANLLNATCTVSFDPGAQIPLLMLLQGGPVDIAGGLNIYCGFETVPSGVTPDASVVLGIWGLSSATMTTVVDTSFIARVSTLDNSLSFYLDATAIYNNVADTLVGSTTDYFTGTLTGTGLTATWNGTEMNSGLVGKWNAGPCTLIPASLSGGSSVASITFTAPVNTLPTPASQTVTVSPATAGPVTTAVPTGAASWLTATTAGQVVTLTITAPQASAGTQTAAVSVWPQFAQNAPLTINVTYNATNGAAPLAITTTTLPSGTRTLPTTPQASR